jgi:hypothetical protein
MKITTRHEIKPLRTDDAQLVIHVDINGVEGHSFVAMSGPRATIEAFVRDEIDLAEVYHEFSYNMRSRRSA